MIFLITTLRSFFSAEQTRSWLGGKREGVGNVLAASLGIITPFCSCSAVPLFIGFVESGIPLGMTFSFLISAPVVNEPPQNARKSFHLSSSAKPAGRG